MADERSDLERLTAELNRTLDALAAHRAALEASRVWWDDTDPYHGEWKHGWPCDAGKPCAACAARDMIRRVLGEA